MPSAAAAVERIRRGLLVILLTSVPVGLLLINVRSRAEGQTFQTLAGDWTRAWDDVAIATGAAALDSFPVAPYLVTNGFSRKGQAAFDDFKEDFSRLERERRTRLTRPWQGFPALDLFPRRPRVSQRFDDWGRAYLLGLGFRLTGNVSPGLLFWLAPGLVALVLAWVIIEAVGSGLPWFGFGVSILVSLSSFCVDLLMLGYSASGFHLISILVCLAYGLGALGGRRTVAGWIARSLLAGTFFALAVTARSVSWTVLPALLIVAFLGTIRVAGPGGRRVWLATCAAACLIVPAFLLRAHLAESARRAAVRFDADAGPGSHDIWVTYWQGLGDFDRTHGHVFLDEAGLAVLREHGGRERVSDASEGIMRGLVVESIRKEPAWFATILIKRAMFTFSFRKLWPMAAPGSPGFVPGTTPNEGASDSYWTMTDQADLFRIGRATTEVPALIFPFIFLAFVVACWKTGAAHPEARSIMLPAVCLLALAALPAPVATTTAGAFEPQSFVLVIFAAGAGLIQLASWTLSDRWSENADSEIGTSRPSSTPA